MDYGEVFDRAKFLVWRTSDIPSGVAPELEEQIILAHKMIQQDRNFWFMRANTAINSEELVQAYTLPTDLKEIISCMWELFDPVDDDGNPLLDAEGNPVILDGFTAPLTLVSPQDAHDDLWCSDESTDEYPSYYEVNDTEIVIYPDPEEDDRVLHIIYWKFLSAPTYDGAGASTDTDELSTEIPMALAYKTAASMLTIMKEFDLAGIYERKAEDIIHHLKKNDTLRRQNFKRTKFKDVG